MAKILIVEDDEILANLVKKGLTKENYAVDIVTNGSDGLSWLQNEAYSLAIVDWELPQLSGVELCQRYRRDGGNVPILMLTGKKKSSEVVEGLDAGADDYLPKPFDMAPLLARIRALLRRPRAIAESHLVVGDIKLDPATGTVCVNENVVDLTKKEFGVLDHLMRNANRICSPQSILDNVWSTDSDSTPDVVRSVVSRLKIKLEAAGVGKESQIRNIYGMGYKLEA